MELSQLLTSLPLVQASASVVLTFTVLLILTGKLVPEKILKRQEEISDKWKLAHDKEVELRVELMETMRELIQQGEHTQKLTTSLIENVPVEDDEKEKEEGG